MSTHYVEHKKGAPGQIHAFAQTSDGYLWIAAPDGLYRFDGVSFERYKPRTGIVPGSQCAMGPPSPLRGRTPRSGIDQ